MTKFQHIQKTYKEIVGKEYHLSGNNIAVIVETRIIKHFGYIVKNHLYHLGEGWNLHVFCGPAKGFFKHELQGIHNYTLEEVNIGSEHDYNKLLTSKSFWNKFQNYERVLIFQSDSLMLRKGIEEYLEYNYVGAAWHFQERGGNGGFSLRNPKEMLRVINEHPYNGDNEDIYFSRHVRGLAPREKCLSFSCETVFTKGTLGVHAPERWLTEEQLNQLYEFN